jgi:hypothetical protein
MKRIYQNRLKGAPGFILLGCFLLTLNVSAQVLKVNIRVNSSVGMQQSIPFETMPENPMLASSKGPSLQPRSINAMGAYTMTGKENTDIMVRLDAPEVLVNKENQTTPYQMKVAWLNNTSGDLNNLNWSDSKNNVFKLTSNLNGSEKKKAQDDDLQGSLYLQGTADVKANSDSPFEGNVKLTIEY